MVVYNIHVNGTIEDKEKDFKCGIDISVSNGGSVEKIGLAIQSAIETLHNEAKSLPKERSVKSEE